jgi:hypothetical protein
MVLFLMTQLSKKLEKLIRSSPEILPVKTEQGILVGAVLIQSQGPIKNLYIKDQLIYSEIHLNSVAIKLANLLSKGSYATRCDAIYRADQEYGKWFTDSQLLRNQYEKSKKLKDFDRADMLWARYVESRDRTITAKNSAEALVNF